MNIDKGDNMRVNWSYPSNGNGQRRGIADAGIETFGGDELKALAREVCQNSLDAVLDNKLPVDVHFQQHLIKTSDMPGYAEYLEVLCKCQRYWSQSDSNKTKMYLANAIKEIESKNSYVLRISDFNTTGLAGPYSDGFDGWNALTKIDGGATKNGDKAGSYGIGKNAPFCNSHYRLVFYRTINQDGENAAQGISRLISFPIDETDPKRTMTTGIGYYGDTEMNEPIENIHALNTLYNRTTMGTDVYIYGFNRRNTLWYDVICVEVIDNFLMAIYNKKLTVKINDNYINEKSIGAYIERFKSKLTQTYCYYQVLSRTEEVKVYKKEFHGLGTLKLRVLVDSNMKLNKKLLITRTSGMKLFALGNISRLISFSGILEMQGEELNKYFREMETPAHDKWKPKKHYNPEEAERYYEELKSWIKDIIISLGEYSSEEELEVEGLSSVLQEESDKSKKNNDDNKKETLSNRLGEILVSARLPKSSESKGVFWGKDGEQNTNQSKERGKIDPMGDPTIRTLKGDRKRKNRENHKGKVDPDGKDIVNITVGGDKNHPLRNTRIMRISREKYRMSFILPNDIMQGHIDVVAVGENGKSNVLKVSEANGILGCCNISLNSNNIIFDSMKGEEKVVLEFMLLDNREYAMEVNVYEHI